MCTDSILLGNSVIAASSPTSLWYIMVWSNQYFGVTRWKYRYSPIMSFTTTLVGRNSAFSLSRMRYSL